MVEMDSNCEHIYSKYLKDVLLSEACREVITQQQSHITEQLQYIQNEIEQNKDILLMVKKLQVDSTVAMSASCDWENTIKRLVDVKESLKANVVRVIADNFPLKLQEESKGLPLTGIDLPQTESEANAVANFVTDMSDGMEHFKTEFGAAMSLMNQIMDVVDHCEANEAGYSLISEKSNGVEHCESSILQLNEFAKFLNDRLMSLSHLIKEKLEKLDYIMKTEHVLQISAIDKEDDLWGPVSECLL